MSDFADRPLFIEAINGIRGFKMHDVKGEPVIQSFYNKHRWTDGINIASCDIPKTFRYQSNMYGYPEEYELECSGFMTSACSCGFHAYHNPTKNIQTYDVTTKEKITRVASHQLLYYADLIGAIEGYGKVVVGTDGFRAEKAKLIAIAPRLDDLNGMDRSLPDRLKRYYPGIKVYKNHLKLIEDRPAVTDEEINGWLKG